VKVLVVCPPDESVATPVPPKMKTPEPPLVRGKNQLSCFLLTG